MTSLNVGVRHGEERSGLETKSHGSSLSLGGTAQSLDSRERRELYIDDLLRRAATQNEDLGEKVRSLRTVGATQELRSWATLSTLPPVSAPKNGITPELQQGAKSFAANLGDLFSNEKLMVGKAGEGANPFGHLHSDQLLGAFLKLQIKDPNNSVETHNELHQSLSDLRQYAIEEARKRIERAEEAKKEAEAYASSVQSLTSFLSIFTIGLSVATGGMSLLASTAAAPIQTSAQAAAQAAQKAALEAARTVSKQASQKAIQSAQLAAQKAADAALEAAKRAADEAVKGAARAAEQAAKQAVKAAQQGVDNVANKAFEQASQSFAKMAESSAQAANSLRPATAAGQNLSKTMEYFVQGATQVVNAGANAKAAEKAAEAQQLDLLAKRMRLVADLVQEQIQEEGEIINLLIESKNKAVDAVIRMMNQQHGVSLKVMAAGMVK